MLILITVFFVAALTYAETSHEFLGFRPVDEGRAINSAHSAAVSPDGRNLYIAGHRGLYWFRTDTASGGVDPGGFIRNSGPDGNFSGKAVAVSPSGTSVAVITENDGLLLYSRDSETGALNSFFSDTSLSGGSVAFSHDGNFIFCASDGLFSYRVDLQNKNASRVYGFTGEGRLFENIAVKPEGNIIFLSSYNDDGIYTFKVNSTGIAVLTDSSDNGLGEMFYTQSLAVSPDGKNLYAGARGGISWFLIDKNGSLSYAGAVKAGTGLKGFDDCRGLTLSPDGKKLYAADWFDSSTVFFFRRDPEDGALIFGENLNKKASWSPGLAGANSAAAGPGGKFVYFSGMANNTVAWFRVDEIPVAKSESGLNRPVRFSMQEPQPNPFNPVTAVSFSLPAPLAVRLRVYDSAGRSVSEIFRGEMKAGTHSLKWEAGGFASGVYYFKLNAGVYEAVRKASLVK
ncbi:MAG: beta-propeller fold lactonase family protein [Fibrobacterota bacterium]